ncbi:MAG: FAD-binding oxidoreductase [Ktedonobacterales bacterium]
MNISTQPLHSTLASLAAGQVRAATEADAVMGVRPQVVVEPETEEDVAALLRFADARGLAVLPRGGGTHMATGGIPRAGDIVLSLARLDAIVEHTPADQTITVQAGLRLADLQAALARVGQELALDPPVAPTATAGGLIATNVSGPRRLRFGGVRDQLLGVRVVLPDGTIAKGGGKVVKNVAGYDLAKLYTGALGTLGVIVAASFRLYPLAAASRTVVVEAASPAPLCALVLRILASTLVPSALDVTGTTAATVAHTLAVRFESGVAEAVDEQVAAVLGMASGNEFSGRTGLHRAVLQDDDEARFWHDSQNLALTTAIVGASGGRPPAAPDIVGALPAAPAADGANSVGASGGCPPAACTLKASLLPSEITGWLSTLASSATAAQVRADWAAHAGHGLVMVRLAGSLDALADIIPHLREAAQRRRGTLVVTEASPALASRVDVWGPIPALEVMRRLKRQFDPHDTLNPGRFAGGL